MHPDYEWVTALGEGSAWWRVRQRRSDAHALVRRADETSLAADGREVRRREAALAARLSSLAVLHPRWVESPTFASVVYDDPGGELLSVERAAPVAGVLAVGIGVAAALAELHGRGILHGAVRPEAILVDASGREAWLIDLLQAVSPAMATRRGRADRLAWVSPEQTGRIDRAVDARSDLYALGLVLYTLATGAPVLSSNDPLEWIHWHLAGSARPPAQCEARVPEALSAIVMKLIAKTPEARYASAAALRDDLARCAADWAAHGRMEPFELAGGQRRVSVPTRLYGREREVRRLLEAFDACCAGAGRACLVLVEGYAGIGKTTLIEELYRPIVRRHGRFVSGKFDQLAQAVPFGALIQAFRGLVRQLLGESEERLDAWRDAMRAALGTNGGVLAAVMPEIEIVMGPQPAPAPLGTIEAQNRFQRVLQRFLGVFARPEHPLVVFLDDLQWADAATLDLLEPLLVDAEMRGLMLIGAFRDQALDEAPQLARTLARLDCAEVALERMALAPLDVSDLTRLVADTLAVTDGEAEPLARLVHGKTGGNPFFAGQFLKMLEREGHLRFDAAASRWGWTLDSIAAAPLADNVVALMTRNLARLTPRSQYVLTLAACIGNRFDLATLAVVSEQGEATTASDLDEALREGLIVGLAHEPAGSPVYAFLHDRVQQAAYALIPDERRPMLHLSLGRLLRERAGAGAFVSPRLFEIVHHLGIGQALMREADERLDLARLELAAGRRAQSSTAHEAALAWFEAAHARVDAQTRDAGTRDAAVAPEVVALGFEVALELAGSRYRCSRFEAAEALLERLASEAPGPIERARVARLRSVQHENLGRYADALAEARAGWALFGVALPSGVAEQERALTVEMETIEALRQGRPIAALVDLPPLGDEALGMVMTMLTDVWSAAYILGDPTLARLISATLVRLSLEHGQCAESAYGYVTHAITVGPLRGDYAAAHQWGLLALAVNERFADTRRRAKIHQQFQAHVLPWCRPFEDCAAHAREAYRSGLEGGDFLYAAYGAGTEPWSAMRAASDLARFVRDYTPSVAVIEKLKNPGFADSVRAILAWALALQGRTDARLSLSHAGFDEAAYAARHAGNPFFSAIHAVLRLELCCRLGSPAQALAAARDSERHADQLPGTLWPVQLAFWHAMAAAWSAAAPAPEERRALMESLRGTQARFVALARHCEANFAAQAGLLAAEIAVLEGDASSARRHAEAVGESAAAAGQWSWQGLAHEVCARLHDASGRPALARLHRQEAVRCYRAWGASAIADRLERGQVQDPAAGAAAPVASEAAAAAGPAVAFFATSSALPSVDALDLHSVVKSSQAISAETDFVTLLARLMRIAIESAGAGSGALVLEGEGGPRVWLAPDQTTLLASAEASVPVHDGVALDAAAAVPSSIVHYVRRTSEPLVLSGPAVDQWLRGDAAPGATPRSIACLPLQRHGRLVGVLYLENRQVEGAFGAARLEVLDILVAQAAIALENARLVTGLKTEIDERRRAQERLGAALDEVERLKEGLEAENSYLRRDLIANVSHDLRTPLVSLRGYLELLAARGEALSTAQRDNYVAIALRQSEHLGRLIDELFELARLDFKGITLEREAFALAELVGDVRQKFQLAADSRQVSLRIEATPALPRVDADLGLIERVFENLLGNALQHTPAGGVVAVRLVRDETGVVVAVSDTGVGIAADELPHIFDRHYRGTAARAAGAGLGLAITRRILELHGAAITVTSEPGAGTCFSFSLPAAATPWRTVGAP